MPAVAVEDGEDDPDEAVEDVSDEPSTLSSAKVIVIVAVLAWVLEALCAVETDTSETVCWLLSVLERVPNVWRETLESVKVSVLSLRLIAFIAALGDTWESIRLKISETLTLEPPEVSAYVSYSDLIVS